MAKVSVAAEFDFPARDVWDIVGNFGGLAVWHPGIESCAIQFGDGATQRHLTTVDDAIFIERFDGADYHAWAHSYSLVSGPLPVEDYRATISVVERKRGKAAMVTWSSEFSVGKAKESAVSAQIGAFYQAGFDNVRLLLERAARRKAGRMNAAATKAKLAKARAKAAATKPATAKKKAATKKTGARSRKR